MKTSTSSSPRKEVSKGCITSDLRKIGVKEGDHLAVALSLKSIGYVKGGPDAFIDALLESVGPNGTIMMNTHTRFFPLSKIASNYAFNHSSTPCLTGLVPETLRKRRNSIRSWHPVFSVTALGRLAKYLTEDHDASSSLYMPYSKLAEVGGKCLCIGLGNNLVTIRHEAQYRAGLFDIVHRFHGLKYRDKEGKVKIFVFNHPPCERKLPELVPHLRKMKIVRTGRIGMAYSLLGPAKDIINVMTDMLKKNPILNLCDKIYCRWCREAERKLDLYRKIENPKFFQKNFLIIKAIALINRFRLKKYGVLAFQNGREYVYACLS